MSQVTKEIPAKQVYRTEMGDMKETIGIFGG
jgi:hypothetical protein